MDNLTVVVPYYRGEATLRRLLDSLPPRLPVIIVDDGYSEGLEFPDLGEAENGRVSVMHLSRKGYFAGAVNAGIRTCAGDVLVLNQDAWLEGDGPLDLLAEKRGDYALIGERIGGEHPAFPHGYVHGTFMFMRRDAIDAAGLLNEADYPLWGCTAEWQWRAARKGFAVLPLADVPGFRHGRKQGERFGSSIRHLLAKEPGLRDALVRTPPLASVIVPCYNYGRYLQDCVHSLLGGPTSLGDHPGQTLQSFEVIIVDDCSTDDSAEIGRGLADGWTGVRFYQTPKNGGTAKALNFGIKRAAGQYITFLSADDMREPDSLAGLVRACEANPHSFVYDDCQYFANGERLRVWRFGDYDFERLLFKNHVHAAILFPKRAWEETGGYPAAFGNGREDWAFNVALGEKGWCGVHVDQTGYLYRWEGQNRVLTNTTDRHRAYFLRKMQETFPHLYRGERPMGCCGGRRTSARPAAKTASVSAELAGARGFVELEYVGDQQIATWTGPVTNTQYRFGATRRMGYVDKRDAGERPGDGRGGAGFLAMRRKGKFLFRVFEAQPAAAMANARPVEAIEQSADAGPEPSPETAVAADEEAGVYPEALAPDPNALTVDEIRLLKLTPDEWRVLGEAESAGKARKSVLALAAERGATANGTA